MFRGNNPRTCLNRLCACPVYAKDMPAPDHRINVLRVLNFLRSSTKKLAATKPRTTLFIDRFLGMANEFFETVGIRGVPGTLPLINPPLSPPGRPLGAYLKRE